jgi:hypothetical protein
MLKAAYVSRTKDFSEDLYEEWLVLMRLAGEIDDRIEPKAFRPEMVTSN